MRNPGNFPKKGLTSDVRIIWLTRLKILVILFLITEIALRIFGFRAGTLIDEFKFQEHPVYQKRFVSDELGINHLVYNKFNYMPGIVINGQGFRGTVDYTKKTVDSVRKNTKKQIIMVIGDSYTEGCCADHFSKSFPDLLNKDPNYFVMNFGVAATDLIQYNLILKRYLAELKPDKVIVVVYCGNDLTNYRRIPSPGTPICFPFKDNHWIFSVVDNKLSKKINYVLKTDKEAFAFFVKNYTLKGPERNVFEKLISYSVIFSKIYLFIEHKFKERAWYKIYNKIPHKVESDKEISNAVISEMKAKGKAEQIPIYFCAIPSPVDVRKVKDIKGKYLPYFKGVTWYLPNDLTIDDYDGPGVSNHFNNNGHIKFFEFLKKVIKSDVIHPSY